MENSSEETPVLTHEKNPVQEIKDKRRQAKAEVISKLSKSEKNYKKVMLCSCVCSILCLLILVLMIVWYYTSVFEEREIVDQKEVVVSEQWIDYTTHELANCTNLQPCREWDCQYIKEIFHKHPDECEYMDHIIIVSILLGICICHIICSALTH
jgi:hypothetical protein